MLLCSQVKFKEDLRIMTKSRLQQSNRAPRLTSSFIEGRLSTKKALVATLAGIAVAVGVSKISGGENSGNVSYASASSTNELSLNGRILQDGTNIRFSPGVGEDSAGTSNRCSKASGDIALRETAILDSDIDPHNGPWAGIDIDTLPKNVQEDCSSDKDGRVWVSQQYIQEQ